MDELNAAISTLVADATSIGDSVNALIDKLNAGATAADLTDEIAAVQAASAQLESSKAAADAALAPVVAAPPAEEPPPA